MEQEKEKRNIKLTVRLSQSEYEKLQQKCDGQMAVWLRDLALDQQDKRQSKYPPVDPDLLRHLSRIGNNINQIARTVHMASNGGSKLELATVIGQLELISHDVIRIREQYTGIGQDDR